MNGIDSMIRANRDCLAQAIPILDALSDDQYAVSADQRSTVGAQYRHVLEHYQCLLEGIPSGRVDYDARRRDETIERSRTRAREVTEEIQLALAGLEAESGSRRLQVQMQCDAESGAPVWAPSSLGRELQFLISHTIHHYALIKLLLAERGIPVNPELGIAPSTLSHARVVR
jgi:hypothetical protein